ncbi:hypothetical protein GCM10025331_51770 [Actinoplanes utahensis]|nr:hypothetical protein Aut01nite_66060 [Actinoplanes utahensis]
MDGFRVDVEACCDVDDGESGAVERSCEWVVHATTPIAGESVIVAKKSLDVLEVRFTFRHRPRKIDSNGER